MRNSLKRTNLAGVIGLSLILIFLLSIIPASASQPKFIAISCDGSTTLALDENGYVWAWGRIYDKADTIVDDPLLDGQYYQCGDDVRYKIQSTPVQLPINGIVAISGGGLALKKDGTVWAWGLNNLGQLGDGTNVSKSTPVQVKGLDNVIAISSGISHNLALKKDGTVWTWGDNSRGQLGDGTLIDRWEPVRVVSLSDVKAIYGGVFAVKDDGTVWTWSTTIPDVDASGKVIDYDTPAYNFKINCKTMPIQVPGVRNVTAIDAIPGLQVTFVKSDGTVWSWGCNINQNLGDGTAINSNYPYILTPVQAKSLTDIKVVSVAVGGWAMALKNDGTVWVWGQNNFGQHGTGKMNNTEAIPIKVTGINNVKAIAGKSSYSIFLKEDGSIWASGSNYEGKLGYGNDVSTGAIYTKPVKILGPESEIINQPSSIPVNIQNTAQPSPYNNNSSAQMINASQSTVVNNIWLGLGVLVLAIVLLGAGCLAYLAIIRKM